MTMAVRIRNAILNPAWICFLWVGMTVGISMIATPVRFTAASITRPVALDVALVLLLLIVRIADLTRKWWAFCAILALIVMAQGVWLIPELAARTDLIMTGGEPPPSYAHAIYSSLELIKIGLLLFLGFSALAKQT